MTELASPGDFVPLSGNVSMPLEEPECAWLVVEGRVLIFAADEGSDPNASGRPPVSGAGDADAATSPGPRNLVLEAGVGDLLIGVDAGGSGRRWLAVGLARAEIRALPTADILVAAAQPDDPARKQLGRWLVRIGAEPSDADESLPTREEAAAGELLAQPDPAVALTDHGRRASRAEASAMRRLQEAESTQIVATEAQVTSATESAVDALASVFDWRRFLESRLVQGDDELVDACRVVGDRLGVTIKPPMPEDLVRCDALTAIARASKVRFRKVRLRDDWWRREGDPLVGQLTNGGHVALLPRRTRGYEVFDPASGRSVAITRASVCDIQPVAIAMVRPLPARGLEISNLVKFSLRGDWRDIAKMLVFAAIIALLALIPPLATGALFAQIVPRADYGRLLALVAGLVGVAFATALFEVARGIALLRARVRTDGAVQLALWDRMLRLPPTFFRRYQVGDLAERSLAVSTVSAQVSDYVVLSFIGGAFGLANVVAMLIISPKLAVVGLLICLFGGSVLALTKRANRAPQRERLAGRNALASEVLQYFTGIVKIRTSGSERRIFARWANSYAQQNVRALRSFKIDNVRTVFQSSFRTAALLLVFVAVYYIGRDELPASAFFAFYLAFGQLLYAIFQMSWAAVAVLEGVPLIEECRPIMDATTESDEPKEHPGQLTGRIEVRNVRFRYPDAPSDLFQDVSLTIEPGEFVAVVGPSGSGKSTLLRLLLGFDLPAAGTISYDGHELSALDIDAVRQQLGVVLQQTALLPGTIYQNIAGSAELTPDEVWDAARHAGLDRDIEQLPDGMDTEIGDGVGVLSGGQRQRLQIARVLASKPRLMFLDEATSALDNLTQSVVTRTVSEMSITRIVIAHRLSTIAAADRVVVIAGGRVVQDGPFDELAHTPGPFADLIARQQL